MKPEMVSAVRCLPGNVALRVLALAAMCFALAAPAQAAKKAEATAATASEARLPGDDIAEGILSRAKPSEREHTAVLTPLTGTWDYVESFWTSPNAEPEHATGSVTNEMIMDGHYLSSKSAGSMNIGREQIPFEGQELIGYDNAQKALSFVAVDTLTTGMMIGGGKLDEKTRAVSRTAGMKSGDAKFDGKERVVRETGHFTNPLTGMTQGFRSELTFVDDDHYKRTIFAADKSGKETKLIDIDYSRRK